MRSYAAAGELLLADGTTYTRLATYEAVDMEAALRRAAAIVVRWRGERIAARPYATVSDIIEVQRTPGRRDVTHQGGIPVQAQQRERDSYWTGDVGLFEGRFRYTHGEPRIVRARVHLNEETYHLDALDREIVPVAAPTGTRTYVHLQPYLVMPDIRLTVALTPGSQPDGAIGEVVASDERGGRRQPIGKAQAWWYPADGTLVIWECLLEDHLRDMPLGEDVNMRRLWLGVEDYLTTRFPATARIVTPFDDPLFETPAYRAFLGSLGYAPVVGAAAYGKDR